MVAGILEHRLRARRRRKLGDEALEAVREHALDVRLRRRVDRIGGGARVEVTLDQRIGAELEAVPACAGEPRQDDAAGTREPVRPREENVHERARRGRRGVRARAHRKDQGRDQEERKRDAPAHGARVSRPGRGVQPA